MPFHQGSPHGEMAESHPHVWNDAFTAFFITVQIGKGRKNSSLIWWSNNSWHVHTPFFFEHRTRRVFHNAQGPLRWEREEFKYVKRNDLNSLITYEKTEQSKQSPPLSIRAQRSWMNKYSQKTQSGKYPYSSFWGVGTTRVEEKPFGRLPKEAWEVGRWRTEVNLRLLKKNTSLSYIFEPCE